MKTRKNFRIENTEKNLAWCNANLTESDFIIIQIGIVIYYNYDFQKNDILNAMEVSL